MLLCFEQLESCRSIDRVRAETSRLARQMGFEHWAYVARPSASVPAPEWSIDDAPAGLSKAYASCTRHASAPVAVKCMRYGIPYWWRIPTQGEPDEFEQLARGHGIKAGLSVPVPGYGVLLGRLLLAACREMPVDELRAMQPVSLLFSRYVHQACLPFIEAKSVAADSRLSRREEECLSWASKGKTAWEISRVLALSEHTVIYHLRNATAKLGAANRQQAVAMWIQNAVPVTAW